MAKKLLHSGYFYVHILLAVIIAGLFLAARNLTGFAEWYASHVYPIFVSTLGRLCSLVPFSVVEILLYALILAIIIVIATAAISVIKKRASISQVLIRCGKRLLSLVLILLTLYMLTCGVNYYRDTFASKEGFTTSQYSVAQLTDLCRYTAAELNAVEEEILADGHGCMILTGNTAAEAVEAMENLSTVYPALSGYYPRPKLLLFPQILSVQQTTGVYSPFTVEANVNGDMTAYNIPFTMCHELSHLRGFMAENEANFIAFLACVNSDSPEFRYSGLMLAYIYSGNALYNADRESWREIRNGLSDNVLADLQANNYYWAKYEGKIADAQTSVNDSYLKMNGQSDGVSSYGKVLDLILEWYLSQDFA